MFNTTSPAGSSATGSSAAGSSAAGSSATGSSTAGDSTGACVPPQAESNRVKITKIPNMICFCFIFSPPKY
jgi:hypothetical protein